MGTIRQITDDPSETWDDLSWSDMNSDEKALWAELGWDGDSWEDETDPPASNDKYWEELTSTEQGAAQQLGYTQELWDEE